MSIFKCKMCGGTIEFNPGDTVGVCDYCGTKQTLPRLDDDKKANMVDRINHFRRMNEYDKAMAICEQLVQEDATDAETYWSIILCRYGVEYVEDPQSHKRIPTVNRTQMTSIFSDEDYHSALKYADPFQKEIYEAEAKAIDEIQKGILAISSTEEAFDVFICYKETDVNGRRTPDSVYAQNLYNSLTEAGFKVFFSRITLEDKLGSAYEPYIFAALNSAKVMIVVGTKREHFDAVWVKNEWKRYLALIKKGEKKILIPAYRDMDPYDLPEEFSYLQSQDMSKIGYEQDIVRGIEKLVKPTQHKETVVVENNMLQGIISKAYQMLAMGNFGAAEQSVNVALGYDPENAKALIAKMMFDRKVKTIAELAKTKELLTENKNFTFAKEKALPDFLNELEKCENENIYLYATDLKNKKNSKSNLEAEKMFNKILTYRDSSLQAKECANNAQLFGKQKRMRVTFLTVISIALVLAIACVALYNPVIEPTLRYMNAAKLYKEGKYEDAVEIYNSLGDFFDSIEKIHECRYYEAMDALNDGKIVNAFENFIALDGYKDSATKASEIFDQYKTEKMKSAEVGDIIYFGTYEQDNNTSNGNECIEWIILEKENRKALVISKYAIDCQPYNISKIDITWQNCSLRTWLNDTFINNAFKEEEQALIQNTTVSAIRTPSHDTTGSAIWIPSHDTDPGNPTTDKIFLPNITEAKKYLTTIQCKCAPTDYAKEHGAWTSNNDKTASGESTCLWWLRSPGDTYQNTAACGYTDGSIYYNGSSVNANNIAVRPAMWISVE